MESTPTPLNNTRLGFHYFPDTLHYRESDLHTWLPELKALGASWLVCQAPADRAIPEPFLTGLIQAGIEPVLHLNLSLSAPADFDFLQLLFETYARWDIHYIILFDRPNERTSWAPSDWSQEDLVERFLDRYIPMANLALHEGLLAVFPPLEPGGSYWDTSFLRTALQSLERRGQKEILDHIVLSAYAWNCDHPLHWGAGGPERWAGAHPYFTPEGEEDQCGFYVFDWYRAISRVVLDRSCPMLILGAGGTNPAHPNTAPLNKTNHAQDALTIAQLMVGEKTQDPDDSSRMLEAVPNHVLAASYYLLAADPDDPALPQAWFQGDHQVLPVVEILRQWTANRKASEPEETLASAAHAKAAFPIAHYLLLPVYEWGVADWHLEIIRPFVKKYQPTIGFSLEEAAFARKVTVVGGLQSFSEDELNRLRQKGCQVERISGDGTAIATQLAER